MIKHQFQWVTVTYFGISKIKIRGAWKKKKSELLHKHLICFTEFSWATYNRLPLTPGSAPASSKKWKSLPKVTFTVLAWWVFGFQRYYKVEMKCYLLHLLCNESYVGTQYNTKRITGRGKLPRDISFWKGRCSLFKICQILNSITPSSCFSATGIFKDEGKAKQNCQCI